MPSSCGGGTVVTGAELQVRDECDGEDIDDERERE